MTPAEKTQKWRDEDPAREKQSRKNSYEKHKDAFRERNRRRKHDNPARWLLWVSRSRAKKKGIEHTLTEQDIVVPSVCPVLGIRLVANDGKVGASSPTLDRVDPSKGYVPDNVKVISHLANNYKRNMTIDMVKKLLAYMEAGCT